MLIWTLLTACQNDRYLNHTIVQEADSVTESASLPPPEPICDGPMISVAPTTVEFLTILTPFEKDIKLRTDTQSVNITNNCDTDLEVYIWASGGKVGRFAAVRQSADTDGAGSGEFRFTIPAYEPFTRKISYTADERAAFAEYDDGTFEAHVVEDGELGFRAPVSLEAMVINVFTAE